MNLVEMKCKNCGAKLEINNEAKEATCRFCGMIFKIDGDLNATREVEEKIEKPETVQTNDEIQPQEVETKKEEKDDLFNKGQDESSDELMPGGNKRLSDIHVMTRLKSFALAVFLILSGNGLTEILDKHNKDNVDYNKPTIEYVDNVELTDEEKREVDRQIEIYKEKELREQREEEAFVRQILEQEKQEKAANEEYEMLQKMLLDYGDMKTGRTEIGKEELRQALVDGKTQTELETIASLYGIQLDPNYYEYMNRLMNEIKQK